jgi:N-methylhydantoinase A
MVKKYINSSAVADPESSGKKIRDKIIALDIGGTTAKCSLIQNGEPKVNTDYYVGKKHQESEGYPLLVPVIDIVEIGNGGGSIATV